MSYFVNLYGTVAGFDQRNMQPQTKEWFNHTADSGGFVRHTQSVAIINEKSDRDAEAIFACLIRGVYRVVMLDAMTIIRRMDSKYIPGWTDDDDASLDEAECIIVPRLFDNELAQDITPEQRATLVWFITDAIRNGVCIIIPTTTDENLDSLGETFGAIMEKHLEVAEHAEKRSTEHSGNAITRKRRKTSKRKDAP